jgi:hypothetical protein
MRIWSIVALTLIALVLGTSFAHVLEWPAKLRYDGPQYVRLQTSLYARWGPPSLTGYVEPAAIVAAVALAIALRDVRPAFARVVTATGLLLLAFPVVFFWRVQPANRVFWAAALAGTVPSDWTAWRTRWETGHAARFLLQLTAFALMAAAVAGPRPN